MLDLSTITKYHARSEIIPPEILSKDAKFIMITGHRPDALGGYDMPMKQVEMHVLEIENALKKQIDKMRFGDISMKQPKIFGVTGMAQGADQYFASACLSLGIPYITYIPFQNQEIMWPMKAQRQYLHFLDKALFKVWVSAPVNDRWDAVNKLQRRNEAMVNVSDVVLAYYIEGKSGGTKNCVDHATRKGKKVVIIKPCLT